MTADGAPDTRDRLVEHATEAIMDCVVRLSSGRYRVGRGIAPIGIAERIVDALLDSGEVCLPVAAYDAEHWYGQLRECVRKKREAGKFRDRFRAQRARYREALARVDDEIEAGDLDRAQRIIRRALDGEPDDG